MTIVEMKENSVHNTAKPTNWTLQDHTYRSTVKIGNRLFLPCDWIEISFKF